MTQINSNEMQILEILKRRGIVSNMSIKCLSGFMEKWKVDAYRAVIETHCTDETRLADILAEEFHFPRVYRLRSRPVDKEALVYVSYQDAMAADIIPYALDGDDAVQIAIADPTRVNHIHTLIRNCQRTIVFQIAERSEIEASIQRHYPLSMQLPRTMQGLTCEIGT